MLTQFTVSSCLSRFQNHISQSHPYGQSLQRKLKKLTHEFLKLFICYAGSSAIIVRVDLSFLQPSLSGLFLLLLRKFFLLGEISDRMESIVSESNLVTSWMACSISVIQFQQFDAQISMLGQSYPNSAYTGVTTQTRLTVKVTSVHSPSTTQH